MKARKIWRRCWRSLSEVKKLLLEARGRFDNKVTYGNMENRKVPNELRI